MKTKSLMNANFVSGGNPDATEPNTRADRQQEQDRMILAAAPELLAACKELRKHADWVGCPIGYRPKDFKPMFDKADAAIAKAEGKQ